MLNEEKYPEIRHTAGAEKPEPEKFPKNALCCHFYLTTSGRRVPSTFTNRKGIQCREIGPRSFCVVRPRKKLGDGRLGSRGTFVKSGSMLFNVLIFSFCTGDIPHNHPPLRRRPQPNRPQLREPLEHIV